jgi:hypothetical protein
MRILMLGLDAAGKTSEFLSCPMLVQDYFFGGPDIRESTWIIRSWIDVRDGCAWKSSRFREGLYQSISTPLLQFVHPSLFLPLYLLQISRTRLTPSDIV